MNFEIGNLMSFIIFIINLFLAAVIVFKEKRDIGSTLAWVMVLLFIPFIGFFIYLYLGRKLNQNNFYNIPSNVRSFFQSTTNKQIKDLMHNKYFEKCLLHKYSGLILMNLKSSNALVTTDNEIVIFSIGHEKFNAIFKDVREARTEINIQYYIIKRDSLGAKLLAELIKKAKEGVKVRVLYDDIGSVISNGGEVAVFFPSYLKFFNFRLNNRNHRKVCVVDGNIHWATWAYVGELLAYGAKVSLYEEGVLHSKTIVVDQEVASVGSTNFDIRSFKLKSFYDKKVC